MDTSYNSGVGDEDVVIKSMHLQMEVRISQRLFPRSCYWDPFVTLLKAHISNEQIEKISGFSNACHHLMEKQLIQYGYYDTLKEIFSDLDLQLCIKTVKDFELKIAAQRTQTANRENGK